MNRPRLLNLRVVGPDKPDATLDFGPGLSLITGFSNTGKSHVVGCIDFALGSSGVPTSIEESQGYTHVALELEQDGEIRTVVRSYANDRVVAVVDGTFGDWDGQPGEMGVASSPKDPSGTLNGWLLQLSGFAPGTLLPKNQSGETQMLSFRRAVPFFLVHESEVISTRSPVLSTAPNAPTVAESIFGIMLTGDAPPPVVELRQEHERRQQAGHRVAALDDLISELGREITGWGVDRLVVERERAALDRELAEFTSWVLRSGEALDRLMRERRAVVERALEAGRREVEARELEARFTLLSEHYRADVARLEFVLQGGHFFTQVAASHCPECGRPFEDGEQCHPESAHAAEVADAARAEIAKLQPRIADVQRAIAEAAEDAATAAGDRIASERDAAALTIRIDQEAGPQAAEARRRVAELATRRRGLEQRLVHFTELDRYVEAKQRADITAKSRPARFRAVQNVAALQSLGRHIQQLLVEWRLPVGSGVFVDPDTLDLVIDGKARTTNGKGVRAVTRAAFNIGLMRHCLEAGTPHPGFVVIDTPLRPFKGATAEGEDPQLIEDVTAACLRSLAASNGRGQTIIMENEDPPNDIHGSAAVHKFIGADGTGRSGFYPMP